MPWTPPPNWTETQSILKQSGQVILDSNGNGVLNFDPPNARTRWVVESVVVSTNQAATATTVPVATLAKNTVSFSTMSQGNNYGQTWSGNQDVFNGDMDIGPCDFMAVLFTPPPGATPTQITTLAGTIAYAQVSGVSYQRRQ